VFQFEASAVSIISQIASARKLLAFFAFFCYTGWQAGKLENWWIGTLVHWYISTLVHWYIGDVCGELAVSHVGGFGLE
jgi:hypothetical protein